jgi:O-antigen/teichoic acid export membrane protein
MLLTRQRSELAPPETGALQSGARSGALLAVASGVAIVANYIFLLAAGRVLGSDRYGSLAALLGLLAVVLIPAQALQMAVSREVSRRIASGESASAYAFARRTLRLALIGTVPLVVLALVLAVPLADLLNIDSTGVVVLAEVGLVTAFVAPVAMGVLQGSQRFHALAALYVVPFVLRLGVFAIAAAAGYRLGAAVLATTASALLGTALAFGLIRAPLAQVSTGARIDLRPFLRYLAPVAVGLIGIALLTHIDLLIVRARFSGHDAGAYAAASAFARVGLFLPATILAVLFPRTAARQARGEQTEDILGRSILATAAFCACLAVFYWATGVGLVSTSFGPDFREGGTILAPFALAIGLFSVGNILVGYHLSRGETRYAWIVAAGVLVQVTVLALVPSTLGGVVWSNVVIGAVLLAAHEVLVGSSVPALRSGARHFAGGAAVRLRRLATEGSLVIVGTTAFVCVLFWPAISHLASTIIGVPGSDSTGGVAWLWGMQHESGYHLLGTSHHTLTGAPFGWDEANGRNLQWLLPYYPAYLATQVVGAVAAFNLVVVSGYVLSGVAMYALVRYLGCVPLVSAWAALAYIVFPWHIARAEHASLVHIEVLALLVLALVAVARSPSLLRFGLVGVANLACWLTSGYYGAMATITTVAFMLGAAIASSRRRGLALVAGSAGCALVAVGLIGIGAVVSGTNTGAGLDRASGDLSAYGLRPLELVVPAAHNLVAGGRLDSFWAAHLHGSNTTEITNYLGLLTFALAAGWLVTAILRRKALSEDTRVATAGLTTAFVVGLLFAIPSPVVVFGHEVWTPSRLLWEVVPAFRVPSRWDPLLMTALLPLAALGLQSLWRTLSRGGRPLALSAGLVGTAMVVSFLELAIHPAQNRFRTVPAPPEYSVVDRTPRGVLAEYPLGYSDIFRLWQKRHGRALMNGAPIDTPADYARLVLLDPAQPGTAQALALLGVTAISLHPRAHVDVEVPPRAPAHDPGYKLIGSFPDRGSIWYPGSASVWQVVAQPAPALVTLPGGFAKPKRTEGLGTGFAFTSTSGVGVIQLNAKAAGVVRLVFDAVPPGGAAKTIRIADSRGEQQLALAGRTTVSVLVQIPRGVSQLLLKTDPPPASEADAIVLSTPRAERASGSAPLHADLVSPDPGF